MFALENFIKGLQLTTHNLSITVEEDKIVLFKVYYNIEGCEEDKRIIGEISISELQAAKDTLEQGFLCAESLLFSNNSLEVASKHLIVCAFRHFALTELCILFRNTAINLNFLNQVQITYLL